MRPLYLLLAVAAMATQAFAANVVGYYKAKIEIPQGVKVKPAQAKINKSMEFALRIRIREDGTWDGGRDTNVARGAWKVVGNKLTLFDPVLKKDDKPQIMMEFRVSEDGQSFGPLLPPKNRQYTTYVRTEPPAVKK